MDMTALAEVPPSVAPSIAPHRDTMNDLRLAIGVPSLAEITNLIQTEILEFNTLNKFELKIGDKVELLPDEARHYLFPEVLTSVNCDIPTALVGPAGSGKSTLCKQIAETLKLKYYLQNAVTGTHELTGYMDAHGKYNTTSFREAFEKGGLILVDEADSSDAGALKWMNTALANGYAQFPDVADPITKHADFRIVMAANTYGTGADRMYVGANQLDASTLDRFVFIDFRYDEKLERLTCGNIQWAERVQSLRRAAMAEKARIVISPRASIHGAKLLLAGWTQNVVEDRVVWKGVDGELKKRILDKAGPYRPLGQQAAEAQKKAYAKKHKGA